MTDERIPDEEQTDASNQPNEYGYAGAAATPEPEPTPENRTEADAESIAVPAGDLTGAITGAIEDTAQGDDDRGNR